MSTAHQNKTVLISLCCSIMACVLGYPQLTHASTSLSSFTEFTGEAADDNVGSVVPAGDVDGDGYADFIVSVQYSDDAATNAGAAYLIYGSSDLYAGNISLSTAAEFTGEAEDDRAGISVSSAGDVNGDGYSDFLIGAWQNDDAGTDAGAAYLIYGSATRYSGTQSLSTAVEFTGEAFGDSAGVSVSSAGDVDGDGYADFLVGADGNVNAAYLIYGSSDLYAGNVSLSTVAKFTGEVASNGTGYSVSSAGDVNGDGYADMLIGAFLNDDGGSNAGAAYFVYGSLTRYSGTQNLSTVVEFTGEAANDQVGRSVSSAGDVNGDGYADMLIGAFQNDDAATNAGAAYLIYGSQTLFSGTQSLSAQPEFTGEAGSDNAGLSVSSAGDVDGDGYADFLVGAYANDDAATNSGAAYLIYGSSTVFTGTQSLSAQTAFTGEATSDTAGFSVSSAGDVNGDGFSDLLISALYNSDAALGAGAAYLGYLYVDVDHDGVAGAAGIFDGTDCNDSDALVFSDLTYYADTDGDGFGDAGVTTSICSATAPVGYVANSTDANDNDFDNDGVITSLDCNDSDADLTVDITYYADTDGDGIGSTTTASLCASSAPTGYSTLTSDCNDSDALVSSNQTYYADVDSDGFGNPLNSESMCSATPDTGYVANNTDDDDTTFGNVAIATVNDDGTILITYANTATQTVDPFTSTSSKLRTVVSTDLRRVVVTNGKFVKVYRDGVLTASKRVNKKIPAYKLMRLKVKTLYHAYDTLVFASARKHAGKLTVFRLNSSDQLVKKVSKTLSLHRKAHAPVSVTFKVTKHRIRVQFDQKSHRVEALYKLTKNSALKAL